MAAASCGMIGLVIGVEERLGAWPLSRNPVHESSGRNPLSAEAIRFSEGTAIEGLPFSVATIYVVYTTEGTGAAVLKLVVNIGVMQRRFDSGQVKIACSVADQNEFSAFVGQDVLVAAALTIGSPSLLIATAKLERFASEASGTSAVLANLHPLASDEKLPEQSQNVVFSWLEDADSDFVQLERGLAQPMLEEAASTFVPLDIYGEIARQIRENRDDRCSFSGEIVRTGEGTATPVVPLDSGGRAHIRNFIFLHDEPARLFNQFAWTVGPDLEIIVDASATGTSVLSTLNHSGKLLVGDDQRLWPDERALAWHRQQFLDRLR